jgi:hypothetical protein
MSRSCTRTATIGDAIQMFETTDSKLARRWSYAVQNWRDAAATPNIETKTTLTIRGLPVTGLVCSVGKDGSSSLTRWVITVVKKRSLAA